MQELIDEEHAANQNPKVLIIPGLHGNSGTAVETKTTSLTNGSVGVLCLEKARQHSKREEDHAKPRAAFSVVGGAISSEEGEGDVRDYGSIKV